jgi:hypothetical protein
MSWKARRAQGTRSIGLLRIWVVTRAEVMSKIQVVIKNVAVWVIGTNQRLTMTYQKVLQTKINERNSRTIESGRVDH